MEMYLFFLIILPLITGVLLPLFKKERIGVNLALFVFLLGLICSIFLSLAPVAAKTIEFIGDYNLILGLNKLSGIILIFINLFGLLTCLYSKDYMQKRKFYFSLLLWLISSSNLAILSADFITFIFSWGVTLGLLYALLSFGSGYSAKKALSIVGLADFSLMLGIGLYIAATGNTVMPQQGQGLILEGPRIWSSFILMLIGALAKAGCGPFHTWIPTAAEDAPVPVMAILPASLDKLLGIYLLARICRDFFALNITATALLLIIGSLTIIFAVMMALIQHDLRRLLSFHAISQVGYMVLGFGTGTALGVAGGLFHMLNHAIYKSGLFLVGGAVGQKRKTFELDRLGALASCMPLTFFSGLVFALSISGVPPFNGFASKWLIYQGTLIGLFNTTNLWLRSVYVFSLIAAMFGSALTLASFIKFIHAIFLDKNNSSGKDKPTEASLNITIPLLVLAGLCVLFGVLPNLLVRNYIEPWLGKEIIFSGSWDSIFAFTFISLGLCAGFILWNVFANKNIRKDTCYIGGETSPFDPAFPATEFYKTIESIPAVNKFYRFIKLESLDLYNVLGGLLKVLSYCLYILVDRLIYVLTNAVGYLTLGLSWCFRKLHSGVLDLYLAWSLAGLIIIFFILMFK
jgi:formate hydrogenlyase subunit 3/multisubunit Na+/H+ antiporter MnhD subunit